MHTAVEASKLCYAEYEVREHDLTEKLLTKHRTSRARDHSIIRRTSEAYIICTPITPPRRATRHTADAALRL